MSPALAGGFFITEPLREAHSQAFLSYKRGAKGGEGVGQGLTSVNNQTSEVESDSYTFYREGSGKAADETFEPSPEKMREWAMRLFVETSFLPDLKVQPEENLVVSRNSKEVIVNKVGSPELHEANICIF